MKRIVLISILIIGAFFALDAMRAPENQLCARAYIGMVHGYQTYGRPLLEGKVACRFRPTCSVYSIRAVEKYGFWHGFILTITRIASCTDDVPMGTIDEVT
ncbi:MAG: membrane protein insertion efficiency factor YidD [Pyrinomonadaceae bacterium]